MTRLQQSALRENLCGSGKSRCLLESRRDCRNRERHKQPFSKDNPAEDTLAAIHFREDRAAQNKKCRLRQSVLLQNPFLKHPEKLLPSRSWLHRTVQLPKGCCEFRPYRLPPTQKTPLIREGEK